MTPTPTEQRPQECVHYDNFFCKKGILIRHVLVAIHIYLNLLDVATIATTKLIAPTSPLKNEKA